MYILPQFKKGTTNWDYWESTVAASESGASKVWLALTVCCQTREQTVQRRKPDLPAFSTPPLCGMNGLVCKYGSLIFVAMSWILVLVSMWRVLSFLDYVFRVVSMKIWEWPFSQEVPFLLQFWWFMVAILYYLSLEWFLEKSRVQSYDIH